MLKSSLCGCYNPYLLASGTMAVAELAAGRGNKNINVACRWHHTFTKNGMNGF